MRYWGDERTVTKTGKAGGKTGDDYGPGRRGAGEPSADQPKSLVARPGAVRLPGGPVGLGRRDGESRAGAEFRAAGAEFRAAGAGSRAAGSRSAGGWLARGGRATANGVVSLRERSTPGGVPRPSGNRGKRLIGGGKPRKGSSIASGGSLKNYPFLRNFYRHQAQISERVQKIVFFLILAGIIYAFLLGETGFVRIAALRGERAHLDTDIAELQRSEALLAREIERLKNDDFYVEKLGREKFGYLKPGDRVYRLIPTNDRNK